MADGKKITDILPPKKEEEENPNVSSQNTDEIKATASVISKHKATITTASTDDDNADVSTTNIATEKPKDQAVTPSQKGVDIAPSKDSESSVKSNISDKTEPQAEELKEEPKPAEDKPAETIAPKESESQAEPKTEVDSKPDDEVKAAMDSSDSNDSEDEEGSADFTARKKFEATDSLPELKTTESDTQDPKIYDTKEYFVPIKDTKHSHGTLGIILAGLISALVILAVVYYGSNNWF